MARALAIAVLLAGLLAPTGAGAEAPPGVVAWVDATITEVAAAHGASPALVRTIALCETAGTLDPYRVGSLGERGVGQWLPPAMSNAWGLTSHARAGIDVVELYRRGDVDATWYDLDGLAEVLARPGAAAWHWYWCYRNRWLGR